MDNIWILALIIVSFFVGMLVSTSIESVMYTSNIDQIQTYFDPDLNFGKSGPCQEVTNSIQSNGYCYSGEIDGDTGVIIIHPLSVERGRYTSRIFMLPSRENLKLVIKVANVAGKESWLGTKPCPECDSGVFIGITDLSNWSEYEIDNFVIKSMDGWVTKKYNITQFAGKSIMLNIYGYAAGNSKWNGEWTAIGYIGLE